MSAANADEACRRGFRYAEAVITGSLITSAAYGDFDEDSLADVAVMMPADQRVVALNRGGHVFEPLARESLGNLQRPLVTAADVDRDGHLDLVYRKGGGISVARGNGNGSFRPLVQTLLQNNSDESWRLVDFNHDGLLDFIGFDRFTSRITFTQSVGDATFRDTVKIALTDGNVQSVAVTAGDFDGDGQFDVLRIATDLATSKIVQRFGWNDGTDHFTQTDERVDLPQSAQPVDLDGDGAEELVAIDNGMLVIGRISNRRLTAERIEVAPPGTTLTMTDPVAIDVDGDGNRDLVFKSGHTIGVIRGTSDKRFRGATFYELPGSNGLVRVDLDGDGRADFAPTSGDQGLAVIYGGSLAAAQPNASRVDPVGFVPSSLERVDVDGDHNADLIVTSLDGPKTVEVLFGDGTGGFPRYGNRFVITDVSYNSGRTFAADYDGDGRADLAITPSTEPGVTKPPLLTFGSVSGFDASPLTVDANAIVGQVSLGSQPSGFIAVRGDDVQLITVSAGRHFTASTIYHRPAGAIVSMVHTAPGMPAQIAVASSGGLEILTRDGDAWPKSVVTTTSQLSMSWIASADLDGDGRTDFLLSDGTLPRSFFAQGDQTYQQVQLPQALGGVTSITPADIDHDGRLDLVVTSNNGNLGYVQVLRNEGGRVFRPYAMATTGGTPRNGVVVEDLDADGWTDVAIASFEGVEILTNICIAPRLAVSLRPDHPVEGGHVKVVVHALSTDGFAVGSISIEEHGTTLTVQQPNHAYDLATIVWSSPALTAGAHSYTIRYQDQYGGTSETTVTFTVSPLTVRRRAAR